jgi:hypothetical protein
MHTIYFLRNIISYGFVCLLDIDMCGHISLQFSKNTDPKLSYWVTKLFI